MTDTTDSKSVVLERTLNAPAELVWAMWTDPAHFAEWYGPEGARIPVVEMDVHVGGRRLVCMEMDTPNGPMQMWFTGEFLEVNEPVRLVYTDSMSDADGNVKSPADMGMPEGHPMATEVIVELSSADDGTKLVLTHVGVPADSPGAAGWAMALDKLAVRIDELE